MKNWGVSADVLFMAFSTQPVAFPAPPATPDRLIWTIGALVLVIAATLTAAAAPAIAESQGWPFSSLEGASVAPQPVPAGTLGPATSDAVPAPVVPVDEPPTALLPARAGTAPTSGDSALTNAIVEAAATLVTPEEASVAAAAPLATPLPTSATDSAPVAGAGVTPVATPSPTAVATPVPPPVATPLPVVSTPPVAPSTYSARAQGLFLAMNQERVAAGLAPLVASEAATAVAMQRAVDMQTLGYFAHVSPSGETWLKLLNAAGIPLTAGGENLAKISGDEDRSVFVAITKLMESPTHAANILGRHFEEVGVAAVTDEGGVTIFVTIFLG